jgi:hypothetical protein
VNKYLILKLCGLLFLLQVLAHNYALGQVIISGTIYDSSKLYVVPFVDVYGTSGTHTISDSTGSYHLPVKETDSIYFFFNGKPTLKFPVKTITDYTAFDISLRVKVKEKYKVLDPVTVFTNSYQMDSLENREAYSKLFDRENPTLRSTYEPGGAAGLDLDELIGMFRFRKNKQNRACTNMLIEQEQERYVDYRFSSKTVSRVTGLKGEALEKYRKLYRPSYFFVVNSSLTQFYEYVLNTSYYFKRQEGLK